MLVFSIILSLIFVGTFYISSQKWLKNYFSINMFIIFIDLSIEKIKYNQDNFFQNPLLNKAINEFIEQIIKKKKFVSFYLFWTFVSVTLSITTLVLYNYFLVEEAIVFNILLPIISILIPICFSSYLILFLNKKKKFKKVLKKYNFAKKNNIKQISQSMNYQKQEKTKTIAFSYELAFTFKIKNIFQKWKNLIIYEEKIKQIFGEQAQSIMYIYIYDINNFKAPYFVFENKLMIKHYKEAKWI
ncbi:Uncharacterised protein [Mycoplasmopsis citelli]|uniref:Transmembrane protein n=1 Tax=Mycoplasmopsis citelli TaxID=171281 RepID=A0A449B310_9BACT|nr:hypothetical protein [Mycoplasmopsis citelli]VEU74924.1 Uncharacterised protein [Mycoplasmopsis citelli]